MEIFTVQPNGEIQKYGEAHNAFGGAMHIWMTLSNKYHIPVQRFSENGFQEMWGSIGRMKVADRWVMAMTFDGCIVPPESLPTLLRHLATFLATFPTTTLTQAHALLTDCLQIPAIRGVCFNQTSVVADTWRVPLDQEEVIDGEESRPYNIDKDTEHWFLTNAYIQATREA